MKFEIDGHAPVIGDGSWIAPTAAVMGRVSLGDNCGVWYSAVVRGDADTITIGDNTNVQDACALHVDVGYPLTIGSGVSIGHNATVHGCTVGNDVLIGMGATVLNGAVIGDGSLIAAGALVTQGAQIPPRSLVAGVPGKVRRELTDEEVEHNRINAAAYVHLIGLHSQAKRLD